MARRKPATDVVEDTAVTELEATAVPPGETQPAVVAETAVLPGEAQPAVVAETAVPPVKTPPTAPKRRPVAPQDQVRVRVDGVESLIFNHTRRLRGESFLASYAQYLGLAEAYPGAVAVRLPGAESYTK
jgi:hypothetical protein